MAVLKTHTSKRRVFKSMFRRIKYAYYVLFYHNQYLYIDYCTIIQVPGYNMIILCYHTARLCTVLYWFRARDNIAVLSTAIGSTCVIYIIYYTVQCGSRITLIGNISLRIIVHAFPPVNRSVADPSKLEPDIFKWRLLIRKIPPASFCFCPI